MIGERSPHRPTQDELWRRLLDPVDPAAELKTWEGDGYESRSWGELLTMGLECAASLRELGVVDGSRVGCVLTNSAHTLAGLLGVWFAGGTALSLPLPGRHTSPDEYAALLGTLTSRADADLLLADHRLEGLLRDHLPLTVRRFDQLRGGRRLEPSPRRSGETVFVQYSSGTTAEPRGCMLTPDAIVQQLAMIAQHVDYQRDRDACYSWLPLSHDMGLFGAFLTSIYIGIPFALGTPERFVTAPRTWLQDLVDTQATLTVGPNFGLALATRAAKREVPSGRMALRTWVVGSEPIDWSVVSRAMEVLGPAGIAPQVLSPAYGLAEATLAVTMSRPGEQPHALRVRLDDLYRGKLTPVEERAAGSVDVVSCARPLPGVSVSIDGDEVGEVLVRSPSLATGYLGDPERSAAKFVDGELRTGDVGFISDGDLFLVGRMDDMLAVGGRNVFASQLEWVLHGIEGLRPGSVAVVDVLGTDGRGIVVLAEPRDEHGDAAPLARQVARALMDAADVGVDECMFLPKGTLPKTPSGKLRRNECRGLAARARSEENPVIRRVTLR